MSIICENAKNRYRSNLDFYGMFWNEVTEVCTTWYFSVEFLVIPTLLVEPMKTGSCFLAYFPYFISEDNIMVEFCMCMYPVVHVHVSVEIMDGFLWNFVWASCHGQQYLPLYTFCCGLLGCDIIWTFRWVPVFWMNVLPPSSGLQPLHLQLHTASQPRTPPWTVSLLWEP